MGLHGTGNGTVSVPLRPAHTKKGAQLATKHFLTKAQGERRDRERSVVQQGLKNERYSKGEQDKRVKQKYICKVSLNSQNSEGKKSVYCLVHINQKRMVKGLILRLT